MKKEKSSKLMYMYRTPFASGNVFSASMIDTLLYQAYGKPFLIEFFRLLIGISQIDGSGNLTSVRNKKNFNTFIISSTFYQDSTK
jgi:potassium channel subfamily T protein 1